MKKQNKIIRSFAVLTLAALFILLNTFAFASTAFAESMVEIQWEKYEPCNELTINNDVTHTSVIAGKTTGNNPMVIWCQEMPDADTQIKIVDSLKGNPGVGNPKNYEFISGNAASAYGMTVLGDSGEVKFDAPKDWALLYGGTIKTTVSEDVRDNVTEKNDTIVEENAGDITEEKDSEGAEEKTETIDDENNENPADEKNDMTGENNDKGTADENSKTIDDENNENPADEKNVITEEKTADENNEPETDVTVIPPQNNAPDILPIIHILPSASDSIGSIINKTEKTVKKEIAVDEIPTTKISVPEIKEPEIILSQPAPKTKPAVATRVLDNQPKTGLDSSYYLYLTLTIVSVCAFFLLASILLRALSKKTKSIKWLK